MSDLPVRLDPWVRRARAHRAVDGDTIKLNISQGFGDWKLCVSRPGGPEAKYPQGVYRLNGINTPEMNTAEGKIALSRVNELLALSKDGDFVKVRTTKHGKFRFLVDVYVETSEPHDEPKLGWVSDDDLKGLHDQAKGQGAGTILALTSELLERREQDRGSGKVIHVNQQLIDDGLAKPYFGKKK